MAKSKGHPLSPGDRVCVEVGAGGGFGPPARRSAHAVRRDVMRGWHPESGIRGVQGYLLGRPATEPWNDPNAAQHSALMQKTYDIEKPILPGHRRTARTSYRRLRQYSPATEWQSL